MHIPCRLLHDPSGVQHECRYASDEAPSRELLPPASPVGAPKAGVAQAVRPPHQGARPPPGGCHKQDTDRLVRQHLLRWCDARGSERTGCLL
jgi:hypothetical protein